VTPMDNISYLWLVFLFFSVLLLLDGLRAGWRSWFANEHRRLKPRFRAIRGIAAPSSGPGLLKLRNLSGSATLDATLRHLPRIAHLDQLILQAGYEFNVARLLGVSVCASFLAMIGTLAMNAATLFTILGAIAALLAPTLWLIQRKSNRLAVIEEQLPAALDMLAAAMQAGHAFPSALKMAGEELPEPICAEFQTAFDEINFGLDHTLALGNFAKRLPIEDVRHFVLAVMIQKDTGGNLSALLTKIATLMRSRAKFRRSVRILTAEGRLSAWILILLPFALGFVLHVLNPGFFDILFKEPLGRRLVGTALLMMCLGIFWMSRAIKIQS